MWSFGKSLKRRKQALLQKAFRRTVRGEMLEQRCLMTANPVTIGLVYFETDDLSGIQNRGIDALPDRFTLSFTGGASGTTLTQVSIDVDKDQNGLSIKDLIFDTELGHYGRDGAHPFRVTRLVTADDRATVEGIVADGGTLLTLNLTHFRAGDILEFTIDVDEVEKKIDEKEALTENLDTITSGIEFDGSILRATFEAQHYESAFATDIFLDRYVIPATQPRLAVPADRGEPNSAPDRLAGAFASVTQVPKPISISGTVFVDDNLNLKREDFETRLAGVQISLWKKDANGQYVDTGLKTTTDTNGRYTFGTNLGLMPGDYRVVETQPTGFFSVGAIPGQIGGTTVGSVLTTDILTEISIPLGDLHAIEYDFAEARPARVSGYVYRDDSDDGIRDSGELGLSGVTIRLEPISTIANQATLTTITGIDGSYSFNNLAPGEYRIVEVTQPAPFTDGLDTAGTINGVRVGAAVNPGDVIQAVVLAGGQTGIEYNFGELPLGSLSGYVYLPPAGEDCDGEHFGDWIPIANAEIQLYDSSDNLIATTRTLADGSYRFNNVAKGEYRIVQITPAGLFDGTAHVGMIDGVMVGTVTTDGSLDNVRLPAGKNGVRYDFCEAAPARVEGYVYHDRSNEGSRDAGEEGIPNAIVRLYDGRGNLVKSTLTDRNGYYKFEGLLPGTYRIEEVTPQGYLDGLDRAGTIAGLFVGTAANPGDRISNIVLKQGQSGIEYNFGEIVPATLEGRVHSDLDGDCELDPNEVTLQGVAIRLMNEAGVEVARTTTDVNGIYRFTGLRPGRYTVIQEQPAGYFSGGQKAGSTGGDASVENQIRNVNLVSGNRSVGNDFCENPPSVLRGKVYADRDGDCFHDAGEPMLSGVKIELLDSNGDVVAETFTDANGRYEFTNLKKGRYTVRETQPVGYLQGGQRAGSGGGNDSQQDLISEIEIGWGQSLIDYDFCEVEPASISGRVFIDSDGDCIHEPQLGETGLAGVTIRLHDSTGRIIATTLTNSAGQYRFDNLRPGVYQVSEVQPVGLFHGGQTIGSGGGVVGGDDLLTEIQINAGAQLINYDFCEIEPSSIAGMVFVDRDQDCVYEPAAGERPLSGVTIQLRDANGNIVATTVTDNAGQYRFANLRPGEYTIFEVQPTGLFHGGQTVGSGGGVVSGQDLISQILLGPGTDLIDYDFCELEPSSIQGLVHVDDDGDCVYEPTDGERPLPGVLIELLDESGNVIASTQTNADGVYRFNNLRPGNYSVRETQPAGFLQGGQRVGSGGGRVGGIDLITDIPLGPGQALVNYDFCEVEPSSISGRVWSDVNINRSFDDGEVGLQGVLVELLDSRGTVIASQRTTVDGRYLFTDLMPGEYAVRETQPVGYFHVGQIAGSHGGNDTVRDVISAINIPAGQTLVNYDFPEAPPAIISGFVYQDGPALRLESDPDPLELRNYRDGLRTSDDTPLAGVVLELRLATGERASSQVALPGTYSGEFIRVVTDENGYYEFTGLSSRAYSVYQVQPDGFVDGLDTEGTVGGLAVNAADLASDPSASFLVQTLSANPDTNPNFDAILLIDVLPGVHSQSNNFSEIRVENIPPFPPQDNPPLDPPSAPPVVPGSFNKPIPTFLAYTPAVYKPYLIGFWSEGVTWHLSVINGGTPRDAGLEQGTFMRPASSSEAMQLWTAEVANVGQWQLFEADGSESLSKRPVIIGVVDGIPLVGDFNGDGQDEFAIYVAGEWLIDLNGNGAWDQGDLWVQLGSELDRPVVGDWDGDGKDDVGIFGPEWERDAQVIPHDPGLPDPDNMIRRGHKNTPPREEVATDGKRLLQKSKAGKLHADVIDHVFRYGSKADEPISGDWNGDGIDAIGIFRNGQWLLDLDGDGRWTDRDQIFDFGKAGDVPVVADFNGDGIDELAVVRGNVWIIDTDGDRRLTAADARIELKRTDDQHPVAGDWDGDGRAEPGYYRAVDREAEDPAA